MKSSSSSSPENEKSIYIFLDNNRWYVINKDNKLAFFTTMPDAFPHNLALRGDSSCVVACESVIYVVSDTSGEVFSIDTGSSSSNNGNLAWKKGPTSRLVEEREDPCCVVLDGGSIFIIVNRVGSCRNNYGVDDGDAQWVEILDPLKMVSEFRQHLPPLPNSPYVKFAVAYGDKKVLVHFLRGALYCYDVDANSWALIDENFSSGMDGMVNNSMVVVEDILYCFARRVYGYDLLRRQWFNGPVKGLDQKRRVSPYLYDENGWGSPEMNYPDAYLVHVGLGKLCLVWLETGRPKDDCTIHCTKFKVCKDDISLHAIIESFQVYTMRKPSNNVSIHQVLAI